MIKIDTIFITGGEDTNGYQYPEFLAILDTANSSLIRKGWIHGFSADFTFRASAAGQPFGDIVALSWVIVKNPKLGGNSFRLSSTSTILAQGEAMAFADTGGYETDAALLTYRTGKVTVMFNAPALPEIQHLDRLVIGISERRANPIDNINAGVSCNFFVQYDN